MNNSNKTFIATCCQDYYFIVLNTCKIFIYEYHPEKNYKSIIFIISGITGINHKNESDIIEQLCNNENRIVVIHPRGTGYSEGKRGDISDFSIIINDYVEIIKNDKDYQSEIHKIILYGHSMSTAILLAIADKLELIDGAILINPPYLLKQSKGMSPGILQYVKYALYLIFARHITVVNMAGNPLLIENKEDRQESEQRNNDPLLVKYFSMYMMLESKKIIKSMPYYAKKAEYSLLLIYGEKDCIVDIKGCHQIFHKWKCDKKLFYICENASHGKSSIIKSKRMINKWINEIC